MEERSEKGGEGTWRRGRGEWTRGTHSFDRGMGGKYQYSCIWREGDAYNKKIGGGGGREGEGGQGRKERSGVVEGKAEQGSVVQCRVGVISRA